MGGPKTVEKRIVAKYGMPLKDVISQTHWKLGISIKEIASAAGVTASGIYYECKSQGIKTRTRTEAVAMRIKREWLEEKRRLAESKKRDHRWFE